MNFLTAAAVDLEKINIMNAAIVAVLGYAVVFFGLILLMTVITVMGKAFVAKDKKAAEKANIDTTMEDRDYGFHFTAEPMTAGEDASELTIWFYKNGKKTTMRYDEGTGLYAMSQHGAASVDGNDDSPITFRNVVVLEAKTSIKDKKGHLEVQTTGSGTGYYARDGKIMEIKWSRESNSADFVYTDPEGNVVSFGVGKTYIAIVPDIDPFSYK